MVKNGIPPDYFLDVMDFQEVNAIVEENNNIEKTKWEQIRTICYFITCSFSTKEVKINDIMPFAWDEKSEIKEVTQEDKERIQNFSKEIINKINNNING